MMQHQIDGRDEIQQVTEVTTTERDGRTLKVGQATRTPSSQKVQGVAFRRFVAVDDTVLASPDAQNDILRRLLKHDQTVWDVVSFQEFVAAVTHPHLIQEWEAYTLGADDIDRGDFAAVTAEDGQVVGVACPTCGRPMLWSVRDRRERDLQRCDHRGCTGFETLLRCDYTQCHTIVFLTPEAMTRFLPNGSGAPEGTGAEG